VGTMASVTASADTLYSNAGPTTYGGDNAYVVYSGAIVTDSFTLSQASTLTGADFGTWLYPGNSLSSVDWSIGTIPYGGTPATAATTDEGLVATGLGYFPVYLESISLPNLSLAAGTYWFTLQNASTTGGSPPALWDISNGPSTAYQFDPTTSSNTLIPSESFNIDGGTGGPVIPEPSSFLLLGSGLLGLAALLNRKLVA